MEVTGAPDLSAKNRMSYSRDLEDYSLSVFKEYEQAMQKKEVSSAELSYLLYNLARNSIDGPARQLEMLQGLNAGQKLQYWKCWLKPQCNLALARNLLSLPSEVAVNVRYWELVGEELKRYLKAGKKPTNLLYEFSLEFMHEILSKASSGEIDGKFFKIERSAFNGEVLIISGSEDVVFSPRLGKILSREYKSSRMALIKDGHRMLANQDYLKRLRKAFYLGGFESTEFKNVYHDEKQLNKE